VYSVAYRNKSATDICHCSTYAEELANDQQGLMTNRLAKRSSVIPDMERCTMERAVVGF